MPICPQCRCHFHVGAKDQCPECGYGLHQAQARLGYGMVDFPRVLDAAGVLSHEQCLQLCQYLEKLERRVQPLALCVYLTDRGQRDELPMHAHWILNHAKINHRAFGRRNRRMAIEECSMQMSLSSEGKSALESLPERPSEPHPDDPLRKHQGGRKMWRRVVDLYHQVFYPPAPPVEKEWVLMLVLDVQLGRACFSWGYKLDAYVDGEALSALIPSAYSHFRDKDIMGGIKKVMSKATSRLASDATDIKRLIRREHKARYLRQRAEQGGASLLILSALAAGLAVSDVQAQEAPSLQPRAYAGQAASEKSFPMWSDAERLMLQQGQLPAHGNALMVSAGAFAPPAPAAPAGASSAAASALSESSDVPLSPWSPPKRDATASFISDDESLLSEMENLDLLRQLQQLNANKSYQIYLSIEDARRGQQPEYSAEAYLPMVAEMGRQVLLIQYCIGGSPAIDIAGQGLALSEQELARWREQLTQQAAPYSNPRDAIMVVLESAASLLKEQYVNMRKGGHDDSVYLPKAQLGIEGVDEVVKPEAVAESKWSRISARLGLWLPYIGITISMLVCMAAYLALRWWRRRKVRLIDTLPDVRLSAEFGSGVSPNILYNERYSKKRQLRELDEV